MHAETLKIHLPKASEVSSSLALTASQFLLWCVRLKSLFLEHFQPAIVFSFLFPFKLIIRTLLMWAQVCPSRDNVNSSCSGSERVGANLVGLSFYK